MTRSLKVLCFSPYPAEGPSVRHRICAYQPFWREQGIELTLHAFMSSKLFRIRRTFGPLATASKAVHMAWSVVRLCGRVATATRYDAVIIHREAFPLGRPLFERAIACLNPRIVFDVDDAIWCPPSNAVNQRKFLWYEPRVPEILRAVRGVVVGSPALRDYAQRYNANVRIIPTTYDDLEPDPRSERAAPVLLWIGNWGNAAYLAPLVEILDELAARHPFSLRIVGGPDMYEIRSQCFPIEYCAWEEQREREWLCSADIGLMPLSPGAYEEGKCSFKLIQYYSAGLPVVASPIGMNGDVVTPGETGFLACTKEEWRSALERLLADPALRRTLGHGARRRYRERFTRAQHAARWADLLQAVVGHGATAREWPDTLAADSVLGGDAARTSTPELLASAATAPAAIERAAASVDASGVREAAPSVARRRGAEV